jgi:hypothetical protein
MTSGKYIRSKEMKAKISATMKAKGGNKTTWKKGMKAWNFEGKGKLKRKFVKRNGKFQLNSHYVFCSYHNIACIPKGYVIHHKDGNSLNDSIENLVMMSNRGHKELENRLSKLKIAGVKLK